MDPLTLSALVSGGSSFQQAILSGIGKQIERKQALEDWEKMQERQFQDWEKMRDRKIADVQQYLKPGLPYYQSPYLPGIDRVLHQAILGNLSQRFKGGTLGNWGINLDDLLSTMQLNVPFGESQQAQNFYQSGVPAPTTSMPKSPYLGRMFGAETFGGRREITPDRLRREA